MWTQNYLTHHAFQILSSMQRLGSQNQQCEDSRDMRLPSVLKALTVRCIGTALGCDDESSWARGSVGASFAYVDSVEALKF